MNKKRDVFNRILIVLFLLELCWLIFEPGVMFGSKTDWVNQHTIFPEYFRNLFYETGNLFPNFAPHIGAGQNIYAFSYYGLWNPVILFSYLLPNVSMVDFIIISNCILFVTTGLLFYQWLRNHEKTPTYALVGTLIFSCCGSLLFHFHRHYMFVNYMPFLILGLIGIDHYFKTKKSWLYLLSTFFMIMMSYYYSVTGIFVMVVYGISVYLKTVNNVTIKEFFKDGIRFLIPIVIAIMMSAVLLLPTLYTIFSGRTGDASKVSILSLFVPDLNLDGVLYGNYALGFTAIILFVLIETLYSKKRENKFLSIACIAVLIFPIFIYLLNGTLYVRDKILLPFMPIFGYLLVEFFGVLRNKELHIKPLFISSCVIAFISLLTQEIGWMFYLDLIVTMFLLWFGNKNGNSIAVMLLLFIFALVNCLVQNGRETKLTKEQYDIYFAEERQKLIDEVLEKEKKKVRSNQLDDALYTANKVYRNNYYHTSLYSSTYNFYYHNFYINEFQSALPHRNNLTTSQQNNILFQMLMGVKYITTKGKAPIGYEPIKQIEDGTTIYQNQDVLPIGYVSYQTLNEKSFQKMNFPMRNEALLKATITNTSPNKKVNLSTKKTQLNGKITYQDDGIKIKKIKDGYEVKVTESGRLKWKLDEPLKNQILLLAFDMNRVSSCEIGDLAVTINGIKNKLTCEEWVYQNKNTTFHYVISERKDIDTLKIDFAPGTYKIQNIQTSILDYDEIKNVRESKDEWNIDSKKSTGDRLMGTVKAKEDGYFTTSIPYDKGFTVYVDGEKVEYEMVNRGFVGFPIEKGKHNITMTYQAPLLKQGIYTSIAGIILSIFTILFEWRKRI